MIGHYYKAWDGKIYRHDSSDAEGLNMTSETECRNISPNAIGRTFWEIAELLPGKAHCQYGWLPDFDISLLPEKCRLPGT